MAEITKDESNTVSQNVGGPGRVGIEDPARAPARIAEQAKGVASHVAGQAKEVVSEKVGRGFERSAGELGELASALRRTREQVKDTFAAPYVGKVADQVDRLSDYVANAQLDDVVQSTESFARREPLIFLGGAFALGLLGARFLKSSASGSWRS